MAVAAISSYKWNDNRGAPGGKATLYVKWTCSDLGAVAQKITELISGRAVNIVTNPGATAPTDNYDVTLVGEGARDVLNGAGLNRDTANTEDIPVIVEVGFPYAAPARYYAVHPVVNEAGLVLTIANAGDAKNGEVWIYFE